VLDESELVRRARMINGAFFQPHAMDRAEQRLQLYSFPADHYEQKIIELEGDLYWDKRYSNYRIVFDELVFPFYLKVHDSRPGLLAYVKTTLKPQEGFHEEEDRFIPLNTETCVCPSCGLSQEPVEQEVTNR